MTRSKRNPDAGANLNLKSQPQPDHPPDPAAVVDGTALAHRVLGETGLAVSLIGMGGIGIVSAHCPDRASSTRLVKLALEKGINFFETARAYHDSEHRFGEALGNVPRESFFVGTKTLRRKEREVQEDIEISLRHLRLERIDLYQIHALREGEIDRALGPGGALEALKKAKAQGKIAHVGVSTHWPEAARRLIACGEFETIQIPYNPVDMEEFGKIIPVAKEAGLGIIVMKALAGGVLTRVETALKFVLSKDVSVVLLGVSTPEQLEQDVRVARSKPVLLPGDMKALIEEARDLGKYFCRQCGYCLNGCPQTIQIPTILALKRYFDSYASREWAWEEYGQLKVKAKACEECGKCEEACPYDLPIRQMLRESHQRLNPYGKAALTNKVYRLGRGAVRASGLNKVLRPHKKRIIRFLKTFVPR